MGRVFWILALSTLTSPLKAAPFAVRCPATASGTVSLSVNAPAGTSRVDYRIGSWAIGSTVSAPFSLSWDSRSVLDGTMAIQAAASDSSGRNLASAECILKVSNYNAGMQVLQPALDRSLSGNISVTVNGWDPAAYPAIWTLNIDGEEQQTIWTDNAWKNPNTVTFQLNTTRFVNGPHELHISLNSRTGPNNPQWINWRAMFNRVVQFQNGSAFMDIAPRLSSIALAPQEARLLGCRRLLTDGTSIPCVAPVYSSESSTVAAIDSTGSVRGVNPGFTIVHVKENGVDVTATVWVTSDARLPHFTGNGVFSRSYQPGRSLFVIAPFFLDPNYLANDSQLRNRLQSDGVNTLGFGLYANPRNVSTSWQSWKSSYDSTISSKIDFAATNSFHMLLTGDDVFRRIGEDAWYTLNWPLGRQAIQYAVSKAASSGAVVGIEAIDEGSMIWGPTPVPNGIVGSAANVFDSVTCGGRLCSVHWPSNPIASGMRFAFRGSSRAALNTPAGTTFQASTAAVDGFSFQPAQSATGTFNATTDPKLEYLWFAGATCGSQPVCNPFVPNTALSSIKSWMSAVSGAPPVAFPPLAVDSAQVHANWMGPGSVSDYASHYFSSLKTRTTYPWSEGIQEIVWSMQTLWRAREPLLMLNRPQLFLVSLAGPSYTKRSASSAVYVPGIDDLQQPGVSPQHITAAMMGAAALGAAGLRLYYFEPAQDFDQRMNAPVGTSFQTGANPQNLGQSNWQAMSAGANLLTKVLEPYLLGMVRNAPAYGRNILTAVRENDQGFLLLVVNGNDWARALTLDLSPYNSGSGAARYRLSPAGVSANPVVGVSTDSVRLEAGESLAYIFPKPGARFPLRQSSTNMWVDPNLPSSSGHE
jgi:hypothetical protein